MQHDHDAPAGISLRIRFLGVRVIPCAASLAAALLVWQSFEKGATTEVAAHPAGAHTASAPAPEPAREPLPPPQVASLVSTIEVVVGRNDTLDAIFRRLALSGTDLAAIRSLPGIRPSLDMLKPGDAIRVTHADGVLKELTRKVSETQTLHVVRQDQGFQADMISHPVDTHVRSATATIDSSLFQAAAGAKISDQTALKLANVFAWDIDFVLDIRAGDRFTAVYEQIYQNGKYLHDGELLAAEFVNGGHVYRALRFINDDGSIGYYSPDGKAMRKAFLRAPVDFTRVSSTFSSARYHPILNLIRGHMGTDYAAPEGTPIYAAGDGKVSFMGTRGGYGNAIVLTHGGNVSTLYGHLSRFAKNIHLSSQVNQGATIGYVGMTGLATGPHLHYEFVIGGVHKNPQTVQLPGAEPLKADAIPKFQAAAIPLLAQLNPAPAPVVTPSFEHRESTGAAVAAAASAVSAVPSDAAPSDKRSVN